eukprot:CAMPEP_0196725000 /NCGR_PEP_ID=MMETSP1091-20130531/6677_1 /TAXON_ID=302021 /ORGANISM="Rhodomonas sp., Strain CCMP768" /LENGTH=126 /DNA_ID=CAMNT_0042067209 /DNA_START=46 /DNA_END=426 /DNA_ORIENTATION=+
MPTEAAQVSQGNFLIPDGTVLGSAPTPVPTTSYSIQAPMPGSISRPIMTGPPVQMVSVPQPTAGYIPQVGEKNYPEGVPVGTLPFEVPLQPEDTPLTDAMCSALGVPRGTLWAGGPDVGVTVQQEV